jgi:hypothetical protein
LLQAQGVDRATGNFKIHLHIDVGGTCVLERTAGTQQFGDESTQNHELRSGAIVVNDAHKRLLSGCARLPASRSFIGHE